MYSLKDPIPSSVDITTIGGDPITEGKSVGGSLIAWQDASLDIHMFCTFGGFTNASWNAHHINITGETGEIYINCAGGSASDAVRDPDTDKIYVTSNYQAAVTEFDPSTGDITLVSTGTYGQSTSIRMGDDGKVYYMDYGRAENHVYSYDPNTPNSWHDHGGITGSSGGQYGSVGVDANHIFAVVVKSGYWTLMIGDNVATPTWTEWGIDSSTDTTLVIVKQDQTPNPARWVVFRRKADTSEEYYYLDNSSPFYHYGGSGIPTQPGATGPPMYCLNEDYGDPYGRVVSTFNYETNFDDFFPIKTVKEESKVGYSVNGSGTWGWSTLAYTGPWDAQTPRYLIPLTGNNNLGFSSGYCGSFTLNYLTPARTYLGQQLIDPYSVKKHPTSGKYYFSGYSNALLCYDPNSSWTLTRANSTAVTPGTTPYPAEGSPNPYVVYLPQPPLLHFRHGIDFDASGLLWIGGNTTRVEPSDYGNVMWYDPSNGDTDYLFDGWISNSPRTMFRSLCACLSRTKILVADNQDNIYKIDAATKVTVGSPINPMGSGTSKSYMLEVSNDKVLVITIDVGSVYRKGLLKPSDMSWIISPTGLGAGIGGQPFGFGDEEHTRMYWQLVLGPDNFVWMFVGDSLYRIDPTDPSLTFNKVIDTDYGALTFAPNNTDLIIYNINGLPDTGDTDIKYYQGILDLSGGYSMGNYISLPTTTDDLTSIYTSNEVSQVTSNDNIRVVQSGVGVYVIHQFEQQAAGNDIEANIACNLQTTIAPSQSNVVLEVYDTNLDSWVEVDREASASADTDFDMSFNVTAASTPSFENSKDDIGKIISRIWQHAE